ncbi:MULTISPECIES: flagellar hook-associated protein FlgL [Vibrio]|uniref:Flagellar hook-associated protein n=1 Tax=Vibrio coralliirubri TaxID=1516159 RepID=A0AA86XMD9_9VIBR|nr:MULTISPECIES: flagellar hook-associated protein FlgL [Vibrio]MCK8075198.1 flagellar hook-associated protein FlgL [Vibrio sp. 1CM2L]MCK8081102.1 flagellar hook-associated protein FlgL [Vibrio sp. 1CM24A]MCY9861930.1 flagellar hook-associated protein FlgL [Vibrio coralliirubri]CDT78508.1 Flagellar hook-associated protein [Vibrio coralliirubri]CDU01135.1 Flagellar hook-associated protein [Vibrio coralliirubri]
MRVTDSQFNAVMQRSLMDNNIRLNKVFEQMSTGLKINHLSDDPIAAVRLEGLKKTVSDNQQYQRNIENVQSQLTRYETNVNTLEELSQQVNELLLQGKNGTLDSQSRAGIVLELKSLKTEMLNTLNQANDGSYLFSGTDISTPAIATTPPYALNPNSDYRETKVGDNQYVPSNLTITDTIGSSAIFTDLDNAIAELELPTGGFTAALDNALNTNQALHQSLLVSLTDIGSQYNALDRLKETSIDMVFFAETVRSELEELDYAEASVELNQGMIALEATQKTFARVAGISLFDLL